MGYVPINLSRSTDWTTNVSHPKQHSDKMSSIHINMTYFILNYVFLQPLKFEVNNIDVQGI